jgi:hypothetical protein
MTIRIKFKDGSEVTYPESTRAETTEIGILVWRNCDQGGEEVVAELSAADIAEVVEVGGEPGAPV